MKIRILLLTVAAALSVYAAPQEKIILLNEGNWQSDNGRISYFENGRVVSNKWFRDINGYKLGDTPNDIVQINDNLIAISVNWSNIVQYITPEGKAVAATEDVPNNRKIATDGRYVYLSSYGHECLTTKGMMTFERGYVAKIDIEDNFRVIDAVEVGWEPEGIACYKGYIFVANTGGYAFQEDHEYETTVSVIDASTMKIVRTVDTGQINLSGKMSQSGPYLCISSPGDFYDIMAATIILDCDRVLQGRSDGECFVKLDYAATYNTVNADGGFYAIGSRYSYYTGEYTFNYISIDPATVIASGGTKGINDSFPGTVKEDIKKIGMPYAIYVNPYTGYIYATDAASFVEGGTLYQWSPEGTLLGKYGVYINPGHFLALPPDGHFPGWNGVGETEADNSSSDVPLYNLQGIRIERPRSGRIYIRDGKKILWR